MNCSLKSYLSIALRRSIEDKYYARTNQLARFENLLKDPEFIKAPTEHVGLYADHGVVHVQNVAHEVLRVISNANGVLIPKRDPQQLMRLNGYAVLVAYLHDIGMCYPSSFDRKMHPEFAAKAVFSDELNDIVEAIWEQNSGNLAWHLMQLNKKGVLLHRPEVVLRELLSLSMCHSKTKVPIDILNRPELLRRWMQHILNTDLHALFYEEEGQFLESVEIESKATPPHLLAYYDDFYTQSYAWLVSTDPDQQQLVADVQDSLRCLRCADALRQRGTVLKTSGGYEIFLNSRSGNAVFALREGNTGLYLLEAPQPESTGQTNVTTSELTTEGHLRICLDKGAFDTPAAIDYAAYCTALIIYDIEQDVIVSFRRENLKKDIMTDKEMQILLEETDDNLEFADLVVKKLELINPTTAFRTKVVPSLRNCEARERDRYLGAKSTLWSDVEKENLLLNLERCGIRTKNIDMKQGFEHTRITLIHSGEMLVTAGAPSAFVYIPMGHGLRVVPLGGYESVTLQAWMPIGITGVVRNSTRNADIWADESVELLMIPGSTYLKYWHDPYSLDDFFVLMSKLVIKDENRQVAPSQINKLSLLKKNSLFNDLSNEEQELLVQEIEIKTYPEKGIIFTETHSNTNLYIIASGVLRVEFCEKTVARFEEGDIFGTIELPLSAQKRLSMVAESETNIIILKLQNLKKLFQKNPSISSTMSIRLIKQAQMASFKIAVGCMQLSKII